MKTVTELVKKTHEKSEKRGLLLMTLYCFKAIKDKVKMN